MTRLQRAFVGVVIACAIGGRAAAAPPLRIVSVDASPAIDRSVPAIRVTLAEDVSWGTLRCAPPSDHALCARRAPAKSPATVGLSGGPEIATIGGETQRVPTAWLVVVDAGAPVAPRWQDVRTAAFAWLDEVPREGDTVAVIMLGETRHVSRTPWLSYAQRSRAADALGFQSLPLMALGRDEALGTVFRVAVAEALHDLPTIPTTSDVRRVVVGLFSDGRTQTAQAALEARIRSGRPIASPASPRTRAFEVEAFWFPHDLADPRSDGSGGLLDVTSERGTVTRIDGPAREAFVRQAARRARAPSERATSVLLEAPTRSLFPSVPSIELRDERGDALDATGAITMPLEREAWPLPRTLIATDDLPDLAFRPPLDDTTGESHRWRAFWLPASEEARLAPQGGSPVARGTIEALVATDRELTLARDGESLRTRLDSAAMLERASGPLLVVLYDDATGRATPMRAVDAPLVPQGTWTAPLVDGLRALRLGLLLASMLALSALARWRKRRTLGS